MGVLTIEGIIDNGQIKLASDVRLPEQTKVYVVVPDANIEQTTHLYTPRLKSPNDSADFVMEVFKEHPDANL